MPFPLISTALGVCFLLMWAFIGGMVFRDGQLAMRREREADANVVPLDARRRTFRHPAGTGQMNRRGTSAVRAAS